MDIKAIYIIWTLTLLYSICQAQGSLVDYNQLTYKNEATDLNNVYWKNEEHKEISLILHQGKFRSSTIKILQVISSKHTYAKVTVHMGSNKYIKATPVLKRTAERYAVWYGTRFLQNLNKEELGVCFRITSCSFKSRKMKQSNLYFVLDCALKRPPNENAVNYSRQFKRFSVQKIFSLRDIKFEQAVAKVELNMRTGTWMGQLVTATKISPSLKRRAERRALRYLTKKLRRTGRSEIYKSVKCKCTRVTARRKSFRHIVHCFCPLYQAFF